MPCIWNSNSFYVYSCKFINVKLGLGFRFKPLTQIIFKIDSFDKPHGIRGQGWSRSRVRRCILKGMVSRCANFTWSLMFPSCIIFYTCFDQPRFKVCCGVIVGYTGMFISIEIDWPRLIAHPRQRTLDTSAKLSMLTTRIPRLQQPTFGCWSSKWPRSIMYWTGLLLYGIMECNHIRLMLQMFCCLISLPTLGCIFWCTYHRSIVYNFIIYNIPKNIEHKNASI